MSYFIFGIIDGFSNKKALQEVKQYEQLRDMYLLFDEEINFYEDIHIMLAEQGEEKGIKFAITSANQPFNSSDLLFPLDKYSSEELFTDETRNFYKEKCEENINNLFDLLDNLMKTIEYAELKVFIVEGYDDNFFKKICTLDEMREDVIFQVEENEFINSCIYLLTYSSV